MRDVCVQMVLGKVIKEKLEELLLCERVFLMKLYIDMIAFYLQKAGGITSVWKELLTRMLRDKREIILILQKCECNNIYFNQIMSYHPDVIYENGSYIKAKRYIPVRCNLEDGSSFISTYYRIVKNKTIRQYTLVHDFTYEYYIRGIRRWIHSWQKEVSVKKAAIVICVSKNTMKDLVKFYPWAKKKQLYVIYNGVSEEYQKLNSKINVEELGRYNNTDFLLYVGSRVKYKRFDFAIEVAECFGYPLIIIGGGVLNSKENELLRDKLGENYIQIMGIGDAELNKIYNKAFALIYPSEYEGFGIPIIEAQRSGCPVIAKKGSSIDEVFGNPEYLMQDDTLAEANKIIAMLKNRDEREEICDQGYINSERFSWERTYTKIEKILNSVS